MYCVCGREWDSTCSSPWVQYTISSYEPNKILSGT